MDTKVAEAPKPVPLTYEQIIQHAEQLPDGRFTVNKMEWLQAWTQIIQKDVASGKLKLHEVQEYDAETGQVPNEWIAQQAIKHRTLH
jgi:hypothetical protein